MRRLWPRESLQKELKISLLQDQCRGSSKRAASSPLVRLDLPPRVKQSHAGVAPIASAGFPRSSWMIQLSCFTE